MTHAALERRGYAGQGKISVWTTLWGIIGAESPLSFSFRYRRNMVTMSKVRLGYYTAAVVGAVFVGVLLFSRIGGHPTVILVPFTGLFLTYF
jgi:hypothetical protein